MPAPYAPAIKALLFNHSLAREAAAKLGGSIGSRWFSGPWAPVGLAEVPEPSPPANGWVLCHTLLSGLCGSDTKQIFLHGSRSNPLTALISFPHVLGHEAVARRDDTGERVALNPWLSCGPRGIDPVCSACAEGRYPACRNFTRGDLAPGIHLGNCATVPGAHAERFYAHEHQLFPVPEAMSDEAAVLSDPVSVSLRSVLLAPPPSGRPVLVYGSGTLALTAVALLAHLWDNEIWMACRPNRPAAALARRLGAAATFDSDPDRLVSSVADRVGAARLVPWSGAEWLQDGPAVVYDTIGSPETVETSLRLLESGGTLVISGVEAPARFEWTPHYFKEIHVIGSNAFGLETVRGVTKHAFEHYFDFWSEGLDLTPLITHRFRLAQWRDAVQTVAEAGRTGSIKVTLQP